MTRPALGWGWTATLRSKAKGKIYSIGTFEMAELIYSDTAIAKGIENNPDQAAVGLLTQLAKLTLEGIRKICGDHPVIISSGYRCSELNEGGLRRFQQRPPVRLRR